MSTTSHALSPRQPTTRRSALALALAGALVPVAQGQTAAPAAAPTSSLDGRRFDGVFLPRGKTSGDADTLLFTGGRFRSTACDRYGYGDAPYRVSPSGDGLAFEAETESPRYGRLVWRGLIRGDHLHATATLQRDGKPPMENWVVAATPR